MPNSEQTTTTDRQPSAVYRAADIAALFGCHIKRINNLVDGGVIPPPLANKPRRLGGRIGRRSWVKTDINRILGISNQQADAIIAAKGE